MLGVRLIMERKAETAQEKEHRRDTEINRGRERQREREEVQGGWRVSNTAEWEPGETDRSESLR